MADNKNGHLIPNLANETNNQIWPQRITQATGHGQILLLIIMRINSTTVAEDIIHYHFN